MAKISPAMATTHAKMAKRRNCFAFALLSSLATKTFCSAIKNVLKDYLHKDLFSPANTNQLPI
jgi:hypothetical protein